MIDEKKIEEAAEKESYKIWCSDTRDFYVEGFKAGINWFLDNLWHDASEEPKEGLLLVEYYGGMMYLFSLVHTKDYKYPNSSVKRWLNIADLLKGGKCV